MVSRERRADNPIPDLYAVQRVIAIGKRVHQRVSVTIGLNRGAGESPGSTIKGHVSGYRRANGRFSVKPDREAVGDGMVGVTGGLATVLKKGAARRILNADGAHGPVVQDLLAILQFDAAGVVQNDFKLDRRSVAAAAAQRIVFDHRVVAKILVADNVHSVHAAVIKMGIIHVRHDHRTKVGLRDARPVIRSVRRPKFDLTVAGGRELRVADTVERKIEADVAQDGGIAVIVARPVVEPDCLRITAQFDPLKGGRIRRHIVHVEIPERIRAALIVERIFG